MCAQHHIGHREADWNSAKKQQHDQVSESQPINEFEFAAKVAADQHQPGQPPVTTALT